MTKIMNNTVNRIILLGLGLESILLFALPNDKKSDVKNQEKFKQKLDQMPKKSRSWNGTRQYLRVITL